ncbi:DUF542 domain-containing protein [Raineyella fluvialis]|uniref:Iron-sulfur cluster repair di-iron protein n=1 Tax=Raineyella fluvialis TaxID=2662261 RepID=A0A5Q2F812_9ACTN|nr:DUF542 domain-containing protein [Raineyella fluvialis]QGF23110.1 iron-sulfur cluster repair di-iron protein [Raineyella fluvialis]
MFLIRVKAHWRHRAYGRHIARLAGRDPTASQIRPHRKGATMTVLTSSLLSDLVTEDLRRASVLEAYGLEYCCGGQRSLFEAATARGLDAQLVARALELPGESAPLRVTSADLAGLAHDIVDTHHAYLWEELPRLQVLVATVVSAHAERHPELKRILAVYDRLVADLDVHLTREERIVFPAIAQLERTQTPVRMRGTSFVDAVQRLTDEHDIIGDLVGQLRRITGGYTTPDDGCSSYAAMMLRLHVLETDLHLHVHKEGNILLPRALELHYRVGGLR